MSNMYFVSKQRYIDVARGQQKQSESAGGVVVTTPVSAADGTVSIPVPAVVIQTIWCRSRLNLGFKRTTEDDKHSGSDSCVSPRLGCLELIT